jgi:enamine deaminase RidA (YjgF/YER057c/UK114 family)
VNSFHLCVEHGVFPSQHIDLMARELRRRMGARAPIWTAVGAPALGDPHMRVEIQVTAFVDETG